MDGVGKSWYTKYRPKTIQDYLGDSIKDIVKKRFKKRDDMPHVIMISGNRGCGKTTFARIISKYYLCQNPHEDGTPCEECETCQAINDILIGGNSSEIEVPGVTELDATILRGVDAIQEVLDDAIQSPLYTDYKVLIVDECHMISNTGQNSLLKIIEDIPQHLVVIFATTDPQKVLQTIKSRCQLTLEVRKQSVKDMANRLNIQFADMKVFVLGEVNRPGEYNITRDKITILEALAMAGDMTIYGNRENVAVIRRGTGKEYEVFNLNFLEGDQMTSPAFYLQQGDVVYIQPNKYKAATAEINQNRTFWISIASTLITATSLVLTIVNFTQKQAAAGIK